MTHNKFIRNFNQFDIDTDDEEYIFSLLTGHDSTKILNYHGYLSPKLTFKTKFANNLKNLAEHLNLRLAGIYAFTAHADTATSIHIDGDETTGSLPWRLCWYCRGGAGTLEWYSNNLDNQFDKNVGAYVSKETTTPIFKQKLDMRSAFIRTNYPHKLDLTGTQADRLTITATFKPYIEWDELMEKLDKLTYTNK